MIQLFLDHPDSAPLSLEGARIYALPWPEPLFPLKVQPHAESCTLLSMLQTLLE